MWRTLRRLCFPESRILPAVALATAFLVFFAGMVWCMSHWMGRGAPRSDIGVMAALIITSFGASRPGWPHRLFSALPTAARERGLAFLITRFFPAPIAFAGFVCLLWLFGVLGVPDVAICTIAFLLICAIQSGYFLCHALSNRNWLWRWTVQTLLVALSVLWFFGLYTSLYCIDAIVPDWYAALRLLALAGALLAAAFTALAWHFAPQVALQSAAPKVRYVPKGLRCLFMDVSAPLTMSGQSVRRWLPIAVSGLIVLLVFLLSSYWSGDITSWPRLRDGLPARCFCVCTFVILCFALFGDGVRDQSGIRVLRVVPLTVRQVHRRVVTRTLAVQTILVLIPTALIVAPPDAFLLLAAFMGMAAAVAPWVTAVYCGSGTKEIGCLTGLVAVIVLLLFLVPLTVGDKTYASGVLGTIVAVCVGIPGVIASHTLLVVERVTPRAISTGRE